MLLSTLTPRSGFLRCTRFCSHILCRIPCSQLGISDSRERHRTPCSCGAVGRHSPRTATAHSPTAVAPGCSHHPRLACILSQTPQPFHIFLIESTRRLICAGRKHQWDRIESTRVRAGGRQHVRPRGGIERLRGVCVRPRRFQLTGICAIAITDAVSWGGEHTRPRG